MRPMQHHGTAFNTGFFRGKTLSGGGQTLNMNTRSNPAAA
eukprot:CAMPEP_0117642986 /NCGR_PEP_ID=MMETSP0802-20121206/10160_1 /TAXON_ID=38833 /ORGANISM="Micromonas sp., Strain CCMP2099" /LENGTH=39 /DNA_ID= /DNA_START= /DNA_END= /DNA_ORIENTATION=